MYARRLLWCTALRNTTGRPSPSTRADSITWPPTIFAAIERYAILPHDGLISSIAQRPLHFCVRAGMHMPLLAIYSRRHLFDVILFFIREVSIYCTMNIILVDFHHRHFLSFIRRYRLPDFVTYFGSRRPRAAASPTAFLAVPRRESFAMRAIGTRERLPLIFTIRKHGRSAYASRGASRNNNFTRCCYRTPLPPPTILITLADKALFHRVAAWALVYASNALGRFWHDTSRRILAFVAFISHDIFATTLHVTAAISKFLALSYLSASHAD